jgi:hypothetical protein
MKPVHAQQTHPKTMVREGGKKHAQQKHHKTRKKLHQLFAARFYVRPKAPHARLYVN